jgi:hypothetical protein
LDTNSPEPAVFGSLWQLRDMAKRICRISPFATCTISRCDGDVNNAYDWQEYEKLYQSYPVIVSIPIARNGGRKHYNL